MKRWLLLSIALSACGLAARAQTVADIRKFDFGNFTFRINGAPVRMRENLQVGACVKRRGQMPEGDIWNVVPENIAYGDLDGDGREEAVVPVFANACGGTMITEERVLVYTLKGGRPTPLPEFDYVDEGCERGRECDFTRSPVPVVKYDAGEKAIVIENQYQTQEDATCCPSLYRRTWYRWDGTRFLAYRRSGVLKREEGN